MIERITDTQLMRVQAYGLAEFLLELEELIQRGYVLDYVTNEHYPQAIGHLYVATLVPATNSQSTDPTEIKLPTETPEVTPELKALQAIVEEGKRPGRKPRTTA